MKTQKTCNYFLTCWYTVGPIGKQFVEIVQEVESEKSKIFMHIKIYCHYRVQEYHVKIKIKL